MPLATVWTHASATASLAQNHGSGSEFCRMGAKPSHTPSSVGSSEEEDLTVQRLTKNCYMPGIVTLLFISPSHRHSHTPLTPSSSPQQSFHSTGLCANRHLLLVLEALAQSCEY